MNSHGNGIILNRDAKKASPEVKSDILAISILFIIALVLRTIRLFELDLNFDEVVLLFHLDESFFEIWNSCKIDNFPPLYPWMLKIWGFFSHSDSWFRFFGAIMGSLAAPACYLLGREIADRKFGWLLGIVAVLSVQFILYSQYLRMFNIQPALGCLSVYFLIKGLKTNKWRNWILFSMVNLISFYVYVFTLFLVAAEALVFIFYCKSDPKLYRRVFFSSIPFVIGVMLWMVPVLNRYDQMQNGGFWTDPFSWMQAIRIWSSANVGIYFKPHQLHTFLLNLPFVMGLVLGIHCSFKNTMLRMLITIFGIVIIIFVIFSNLGQSIMAMPYFLFIMPIYFTIVLIGWYSVRRKLWRIAGFILIFSTMLISSSTYYIDFYYFKGMWGFVGYGDSVEGTQKHTFINVINEVTDQLTSGDVIIHYSEPLNKTNLFFPAIYYHKRALPEYLYAKSEIPQYRGGQYLEEGDQIRSLFDLSPLPKGIWIVSTFSYDFLFNDEAVSGIRSPRWINDENLPGELEEASYEFIQSIEQGIVHAIYLQRSNTDINSHVSNI